MRNSLLKGFAAAASIASIFLVFDTKARANDWGCQVILCLSNPGGPTQYAQCRPPIRRLWRSLAKGHSFPTCSGVGFQSSRPGYAPYSCDEGYMLTSSYGPYGREATCISTSLREVSSQFCSFGRKGQRNLPGSVFSARWHRENGHARCMAEIAVQPKRRQQPHYIDVTIKGVGRQRVWY
jgi:hypothetical protein